MPTRNYSNTAVGTSIPAGTTATATTFDVASLSGYPAVPFVITVDKTVPNKGEAMLVTAVAGVTLTVTRGYDGTAAVAHDPGAKVSHDHIAIDYREPQERLDKLETAPPPPRLQAPAFAAARPHDTIIEDVGTNECPNPSFEVDLAGWAGIYTAPTMERISGGISGGWVLRATHAASAANQGVSAPTITIPAALTADRILCTSIFALSSKNFVGSQVRFFLQSFNASGALISTQTAPLQLKNKWARYSQSWALPTGTKTWRLEILKDNYSEVAFTWHIDCVQFEYDRYTPSAYLDGSLGPGYTWDGTPHNSASRRAAGVIVGRSSSYLRVENLEVVRDVNAHLLRFGEVPERREISRFGGIAIPDNRNETWPVGDMPSPGRVRWDFSEGGTIGLAGYGYGALQTIIPWTDDSGGGVWQIFYSQARWTNGLAGGGIMVRYGTRAGGWQAWRPLMQGDVQWNAASLTNGWVNYQQGWPDASYRKMSDGTVHLRGMMMNGTGNAVAFWLPDGYKPSSQLLLPAQSSGGMTRIDVYADGRVYVAGPTAGWISLDAIRFRAEA